MDAFLEVERLALALPEQERVMLVNRLLDSLPPGMDEFDDGEGMAEAMRRSAEYDADPSIGITLEELDEKIRGRRAGGLSPEEVSTRLDAGEESSRGSSDGTPRRFMRLAGSVQGAPDLSARRGFSRLDFDGSDSGRK